MVPWNRTRLWSTKPPWNTPWTLPGGMPKKPNGFLTMPAPNCGRGCRRGPGPATRIPFGPRQRRPGARHERELAGHLSSTLWITPATAEAGPRLSVWKESRPPRDPGTWPGGRHDVHVAGIPAGTTAVTPGVGTAGRRGTRRRRRPRLVLHRRAVCRCRASRRRTPRGSGACSRLDEAGPGRAARSRGPAAALLDTLPVKGRAPDRYDRERFGQAWLDVDRNGCDTRNDILRRDLVDGAQARKQQLPGGRRDARGTPTPASQSRSARVRSSRRCRSTTSSPSADAWQKGAQQLDRRKREAFANDPLNLIAADGPANQQKGAGDAATWLPPNKAFRCAYVARQVARQGHLRAVGHARRAGRDAQGPCLLPGAGDGCLGCPVESHSRWIPGHGMREHGPLDMEPDGAGRRRAAAPFAAVHPGPAQLHLALGKDAAVGSVGRDGRRRRGPHHEADLPGPVIDARHREGAVGRRRGIAARVLRLSPPEPVRVLRLSGRPAGWRQAAWWRPAGWRTAEARNPG